MGNLLKDSIVKNIEKLTICDISEILDATEMDVIPSDHISRTLINDIYKDVNMGIVIPNIITGLITIMPYIARHLLQLMEKENIIC